MVAREKTRKDYKRELSTLADQLQHAVTVVCSGCTFFHSTIVALATHAETCSSVAWSPHSPQSRHEVRSGMMKYALILPGAPRRPAAPRGDRCFRIMGCGARWGSQWSQLMWDEQSRSDNHTTKELIPAVVI